MTSDEIEKKMTMLDERERILDEREKELKKMTDAATAFSDCLLDMGSLRKCVKSYDGLMIEARRVLNEAKGIEERLNRYLENQRKKSN